MGLDTGDLEVKTKGTESKVKVSENDKTGVILNGSPVVTRGQINLIPVSF